MKKIRTWVYALVEYKDKILVIEKSRWPFKWKYDLAWWKIEHWENHIESLKRELDEELGLREWDYEIIRIFSVEEDFVKHTWKDTFYDEHIIAIVYKVKIKKYNLNLNYKEIWWDAWEIKLLEKQDKENQKTKILEKILARI